MAKRKLIVGATVRFRGKDSGKRYEIVSDPSKPALSESMVYIREKGTKADAWAAFKKNLETASFPCVGN